MIFIKPDHPDDWMNIDPETVLQEMAGTPDDIKRVLTQYQGALFEHLLKVFYFRNQDRDLKGWMASIFKCAFRVPRQKSDKKFPSREKIYEILWGIWYDSFPEHHSGWVKDFNDKSNPNYSMLPYIHKGGNEKNAYKFVRQYFLWLSLNLSLTGKVTNEEVSAELQELLRKHPDNGN
jgi:hypothetical protein